jgi:hypothetical protein
MTGKMTDLSDGGITLQPATTTPDVIEVTDYGARGPSCAASLA